MTDPYHDGPSPTGANASDAALDALLAAADADILAALDSALDLDAGYAAIVARHTRLSSSSPPPARSTAEQPPVASPAGQPRAASDTGGVEAVCDDVDRLTAALDAETNPDRPDRMPVACVGYFRMAGMFLTQLRAGLPRRALSRADAARLLGGVGHDLQEAARLLALQLPKPSHTTSPAGTDDLAGRLGAMQDQLALLQAKVMRLFDDSNDQAPRVPTP